MCPGAASTGGSPVPPGHGPDGTGLPDGAAPEPAPGRAPEAGRDPAAGPGSRAEPGTPPTARGPRPVAPPFAGATPRPGTDVPAVPPRHDRPSGAWTPTDPAGERLFRDVGSIDLESGLTLPDVTVAYETWGTLAPDGSNAVLVLHALTGDSHVRGEEGPGHPTPGWWSQMVGPGAPIDTERYFVVAPNVVGGCQGSTGPSSTAPDGRPWGSRFPHLTVRDQVAAEVGLARALGISSWHFVVGGSMGGLRALEWALCGPEAGIEVESVGIIASGAQTTGDQIAWAHPQIAAILADPAFRGGDYYDAPDGAGPHVGLGIARQVAHATYRSATELDRRFGRIPQRAEDPLRGGRYAIQSYLDHHAHKLACRFDANSYLVLTQSMLTHDIGRDRGGVETALASVRAKALVVAVDSDRLFQPAESERITRNVPGAWPLQVLRSEHGHDGFLVEFDQLGPVVRHFLSRLVTRRG